MLTLCTIYVRLRDNVYVAGTLRGLRYVVIGLIASAALLLMNGETFIDTWSYILFAAVFIGTLIFKANPILLIVLSGFAGWLLYN